MSAADVAVPFFLRLCDRFPDFSHHGVDSSGYEEEDEEYRNNRKSYELIESAKSLVEKEPGATELMLKLLGDDDDPDGSIIWLSDDIYMSKTGYLQRYTTIYEIVMNGSIDATSGSLYISRQSPKQAVQKAPQQQQEQTMDTALLLLAHAKTIRGLHIERADLWGLETMESDAVFPASFEALQAFVSKAQSTRSLFFQKELLLSADQWLVISCHCNNNVILEISIEDAVDVVDTPATTTTTTTTATTTTAAATTTNQLLNPTRPRPPRSPLDAMIEAMNRNQCPAKLRLIGLDSKPTKTPVFAKFAAALGSTTSLHELDIEYEGGRDCLFMLCHAISQNRGLVRLDFEMNYAEINLTDAEWEIFCKAVAAHPTLQILHCGNLAWHKDCSIPAARDQVWIDCISQNTTLQDFTYHNSIFHNERHVEEIIRPVWEWNRFRASVQAKKQPKQQQQPTETTTNNSTATTNNMATRQQQDQEQQRRQKMFAAILRSDVVEERPSYLFYLLQQNPELVAEWASPPNVLGPLWKDAVARVNQELGRFHHELAQLEAVEERMRNSGLEPPGRRMLPEPLPKCLWLDGGVDGNNKKRQRLT